MPRGGWPDHGNTPRTGARVFLGGIESPPRGKLGGGDAAGHTLVADGAEATPRHGPRDVRPVAVHRIAQVDEQLGVGSGPAEDRGQAIGENVGGRSLARLGTGWPRKERVVGAKIVVGERSGPLWPLRCDSGRRPAPLCTGKRSLQSLCLDQASTVNVTKQRCSTQAHPLTYRFVDESRRSHHRALPVRTRRGPHGDRNGSVGTRFGPARSCGGTSRLRRLGSWMWVVQLASMQRGLPTTGIGCGLSTWPLVTCRRSSPISARSE